MRNRVPGSLAILLALLAACSSPPPGASPSPSLTGEPAPTGFAGELRSAPFGEGTVAQVIGVLAAAGVGTYDDPEAAEPISPVEEPAVPLRLLRDQARALALEAWAGGGIPASLIDGILPGEPDLAPASYILAGYAAAVDTPSAEAARSLIGEQDLTDAPNLVFPQLVLTLFVADVLRDRAAAPEARAGREMIALAAAPYDFPIEARPTPSPAYAAFSPCAAVSGFISGVLTRVFDAIKFNDPGAGGTAILKTVWNWVVSVLEVVVQTIVKQFGERVLNLIGRAAGIVATISVIVSAVRPWTVTVKPEPWVREKGIAGVQPSQEGSLVVRVDLGGVDKWPGWIEDCAKAADRPLPNLKPEGTPVFWDPLVQTPADLVLAAAGESKLDASGSARLMYTTLTDYVEPPYETKGGTIWGRVTLERQSIRDLATIAEQELLGGLGAEVQTYIWGPILKPRLDAAIADLSKFLSYHSAGGAGVLYHVQQPTPSPTASASPTEDEFCSRYRAYWSWAQTVGDDITREVAAEIERRFLDMHPYAPPQLVGYVDLVIRIYGTFARAPEPYQIPLTGQQGLERLPEALRAMHTYCGIPAPF